MPSMRRGLFVLADARTLNVGWRLDCENESAFSRCDSSECRSRHEMNGRLLRLFDYGPKSPRQGQQCIVRLAYVRASIAEMLVDGISHPWLLAMKTINQN